jgi:nucleoredoxin
MRLSIVGTILFGLAGFALAGNLSPLAVKDISLMLRSGYSSTQVEAEVSTRHFIGTLDAAGEKNLLQAGASPTLIDGLKKGTFAVPATELAAVQAELAAKAQKRATELQDARKYNTLYQAKMAEAHKAPAPNSPVGPGGIASLVKGELVNSRNGVLRPCLDTEFEKKKLIGLYFSAHWCPPCRKFTPTLVAYYNRVAAAHPEFEILFVSDDKDAAAMENYMRDDQMPWPALSFDKIASNAGLRKYAGSGIPCLVVVDDSGKVVFDSYSGGNYRGPEAVLADLDQLFSGKTATQLAQVR